MFDKYKSLFGKSEEEKKEGKNLFSKIAGKVQSEFNVLGEEAQTAEKKVKIQSNPNIVVSKTQKLDIPKVNKASILKREKKRINPFFFLIKILVMVKKDFKILLRSKTSSLILLFGPLFIIFLVGTSFNTSSLYDLRIGVYSTSYSELSDSLINNLKDQQYKTLKAETQQECIDGVKFGTYNVCVIFPPEMTIGNDQSNEIRVYVDQSRMNIAYIISNDIFQKVEEKSSELSLGLTSNILEKLDSTKVELGKTTPVISSVIGGNSDNSLRLRTVKDNFNSLDTGFTELKFNFTGVDAEIKDIRTKYNLSSTVFRKVDDRLDDIKKDVDALKSKLSKVNSAKESYVKDIETVDSSMQGGITNLNDLKRSIDAIVADINSLAVTRAETIATPIKTKVYAVADEENHLTNIFPTLLMLVVMLIGIVISSTLIISEKTSSSYFRNFITPTTPLTFMISNYISNFLVIVIEIAILFGAASYFLQSKLFAIPEMVVITLLSGTVFILMGMFIGYVFSTEETANLAAISAGSIMLFFSNTILPIEALSGFLRQVVKYNPFVTGEAALKKVILFNVGLKGLTEEIYILLLFGLIFLMLCFIAREASRIRK